MEVNEFNGKIDNSIFLKAINWIYIQHYLNKII